MATTNFINYVTIPDADWFNAVDAVVYDILNGATTVAAAQTALSIPTATSSPTFTNLTLTGQITIQGGTPGSGQVLTSDGAGLATWEPISVDVTTIVINDNDSTAFEVREAGNNYIIVDTTNGSELVTFGNATTNPKYTFAGTPTIGIAVASTTSRLEIEDAGLAGSGPIVKITADDQNIPGLVIGNDTFSATDTHGLSMFVNNVGAAFVQSRNGSAAPLCLGVDQGTSIFVIDNTGHIIIGENSLSTSAARLEIEDGATSKTILLKVTQDDANVQGIVVGNDTFSATDLDGIRIRVDNSGSMHVKGNGTGGHFYIGYEGGGNGSNHIGCHRTGYVVIGDLNSGAPTTNAAVEIINRIPGVTRTVKITQNSQTENALIIGNDSFSTNDDHGLVCTVSNAGLASVRAAGTNSELQLGVAASTNALTIDKTNGGLYTASATGSSQGAGTINAQAFFDDGVALAPVYRGSVASNGASVNLPSGWSSAKDSTGNYTITHTLGTANFIVCITGSNTNVIGTWDNKTNTTFGVDTTNDGGAFEDNAFDFMVMLYN